MHVSTWLAIFVAVGFAVLLALVLKEVGQILFDLLDPPPDEDCGDATATSREVRTTVRRLPARGAIRPERKELL
jgi:hypothetical protein